MVVKSELVFTLNEKFPGLHERDAQVGSELHSGTDGRCIVQGERIEIRCFGSFNLSHRQPRIARNPKTGEVVKLPAKVATHFN